LNDYGTTDDLYFEWLYGQVGSVTNRNPSRSYWTLTRQLYTTEFTWFVPNDGNRVADGMALRIEFMEQYGVDVEETWMELGCSFLEMLIALSRRAAFQDGKPPYEWFWIMVDHLGLRKYSDDRLNRQNDPRIAKVLRRVNERKYEANGRGGLFPLKRPHMDQTEVEIWGQLSAYIVETEYAEYDTHIN